MKILIVDDEIKIVEALAKCVLSKGLQADSAADGKEALALIKKHDYDLVFLDVNMPELNGLEVLKYMREQHSQAKVIFLTAYPELDEDFCKALGAEKFLNKPVDFKAIAAIIDEYCAA